MTTMERARFVQNQAIEAHRLYAELNRVAMEAPANRDPIFRCCADLGEMARRMAQAALEWAAEVGKGEER